MKAQQLILLLSLMSWAWLSQTWLAATALVLLIGIAQFGPWRWQLSLSQFCRCADLSSLLVVMFLLDVYVLQPSELPIFVVLKWLPVLFAPSLLAQLFSSQGKLPLAALFFSLRKQKVSREIDFIIPYTGITILSAGAANVQTSWYFVLSTLLFACMLWQVRPKRYGVNVWLLSISLLIGCAYWGQLGLRQLQNIVEEVSVDWLSEWQNDPFTGETSIGDIGELKLSNKIEFRVKTDHPLLLHQASYDIYLGQQWSTSKREFSSDNPFQNKGQLQHLEILQTLYRETVLALPDGTVKITGLDDAYLQYTEFGAVKATPKPGLAQYDVFYTGVRTGVPTPYDLKLPKQHQDWLQQVYSDLQLDTLSAQAKVTRIQQYFQENYFYSLYLGKQPNADLALREFMLKRKAGHCEYFATATVLLLRQAGIPARLANGYAVDEYDAEHGWYIVRSRHAHAWALAYIDGVWQNVDSTPSRWLAMESEQHDTWQNVTDAWSDLLFNLKKWQIQLAPQSNNIQVLVGCLLLLYLAWRVYSAKRKLQRPIVSNKASSTIECTGLDSEFYGLEQRLQSTAYTRHADETILQWLERLQMPELTALYYLHCRLRFDPAGLTVAERRIFQARVAAFSIQR